MQSKPPQGSRTKRNEKGQFVSTERQGMILCTGPSHPEPTWLPATVKYFYRHKSGPRKGKLVARCRLCLNWNKLNDPGNSLQGWISLERAWDTFNEAVNRIGLVELSRRTGLSQSGIANVLYKRQTYVRRHTLRLVMLELISVKRKNEYPINAHSRQRNQIRLMNGQELCAGCGVPNKRYTEGCNSCLERKYKREKRNGG